MRYKSIDLVLSRDNLLDDFAKTTLRNKYMLQDEIDSKTFQTFFARVAWYGSSNPEHAQIMYDIISKRYFIPATPVLTNLGGGKGHPISCFLNSVSDSMENIIATWKENAHLSAAGGGVATDWSQVRSIGETIGVKSTSKNTKGITSGIIPFIKTQEAISLSVSQGQARRGAQAAYLHISHPEIIEFINIRKIGGGGDVSRKALHLNNGVVITDKFMEAVRDDLQWDLISPKTNTVIDTVSARNLYTDILDIRIATGEPYILYIDSVNRAIAEHHKKAGLYVSTSNLCTEIMEHTSEDRTAVCCLGSINLVYWNTIKHDKDFIKNILEFLDNVLQVFIDSNDKHLSRAIFSASQERSIGLGVMGFHSLLQSLNLPFKSVLTRVLNKQIFQHIKEHADLASKDLAAKRGICPDAAKFNIQERFTNKIAIAPTASISIIGGNSPGIEPYVANIFTHKTLNGSFVVKNPYLEKVLDKYNRNNDATWSLIHSQNGSVQSLNYLSEYERDVFKTAFEIDQERLVLLAAERTTYICQGQSLNLFFKADSTKEYIFKVHYDAWQKGVKSLYYLRSLSVLRAENISHFSVKQKINQVNNINSDECEVCQ
ncbi:MAG: ribonucleoside-diphosphate reductase subunit alpha [Pseudomonadota bacterium]